jgi:DNA polymerase III subunit delta'
VPELATEHQPRARLALNAALSSGPSHAYLFRGPRGSGKRAAARAFSAEILASGAADPEDARRRAAVDPSPHPDLVWVAPRGAQHLVEEVRERVIRAASYRPFEGEKRVFVIEAAETMRDESQNALLKTLEEPPEFAHLILLSSEPELLLETVVSRCQPVEFAPLPAEVVEAALTGAGEGEEIAAAACLSGGDVQRARFLLSETGKELRQAALAFVGAVGSDAPGPLTRGVPGTSDPTAPWRLLLDTAEAACEDAEAVAREALEEQAAAGFKRSAKDMADETKRAGRRGRTEVLDLGLELIAVWFRDLAAVVSGAEEAVYNRDQIELLTSQATELDVAGPRRAAELVQDTRRRFELNVSEELALEALLFRLAPVLA